MMKINEVMEVAKWFNDSSLTEFKWEEEDAKLELKKEGMRTGEAGVSEPVRSVPVPVQRKESERPVPEERESVTGGEEKEETSEGTGFLIKSPVVGTFYDSPAPGEKAFVTVGDRVKQGQVVCIVEAMKLLNEITSPVDGIVKKVFVSNEELLEFDQKIMEIEV